MFTEKVQDALNTQINAELSAYYTYLSMAAYFEAESLKGFAAWMYHHAEEEMNHAMRIYRFVHERMGRVKLQAIAAPKTEWKTSLEAFEDALVHERKVTGLINQLVDLARSEGDHATESFLQWFVDEQVEEELIVDEKIQDLKRIGDFGPGIFMLDRELSAQSPSVEGEEEE